MQTGSKASQGAQLVPYTTAMHYISGAAVNCGNPLTDVNFGDEDSVESARGAVRAMTTWDDMMTWGFQDQREDEAWGVLVQIVLCQQAERWEEEHYGEIPVEGLTVKDLHAAQVKFFSLLSPLGVQAMLGGDRAVVKGGIRYIPDTGNPLADTLLSMTVPEDVIQALQLQESESALDVVAILNTHAQAWRDLASVRQQAQYLEGEAWSQREEGGNSREAALHMEAAAEFWADADSSGLETARALTAAAANWRCADEFLRAAELDARAATMWAAACRPFETAHAYVNLGVDWRRAGRPDLAITAGLREAALWEEINRSSDAADALDALSGLFSVDLENENFSS